MQGLNSITAAAAGCAPREAPRNRAVFAGCRILAFSAVVMFLISSGKAQSASVTEYQVKAAFLFHFAEFVTWPAGALGNAGDSFLICVLGDDPFHGDLETTIQGKILATRTVRVRHVEQEQETQGCHVLFIGKNELKGASSLAATLRNMPVLTVGESDNFLQSGGIIRFCMEDRKVRFEINQEAAEAANLKISSRLLLLAKTVVKREGGT
jgi:hypothetical protein